MMSPVRVSYTGTKHVKPAKIWKGMEWVRYHVPALEPAPTMDKGYDDTWLKCAPAQPVGSQTPCSQDIRSITLASPVVNTDAFVNCKKREI